MLTTCNTELDERDRENEERIKLPRDDTYHRLDYKQSRPRYSRADEGNNLLSCERVEGR
jgi:hypothetical protein